MGWFNANAAAPEGSEILDTLYQNFPSKMVWNAKKHRWTERQREVFAIGRMYYIYPSAREHFYLRLLLTCVKGAISFEHLRTFEGTEHATYKEAYIARGLLEDDSEWHQCLEEAKDMQMGGQLRRLFVTILCDCFPTNPRALWDNFKSYLCDDLAHYLRQETDIHEPTEEQIYDCGLYLIDKLLAVFGKRLRNWPSLPLPDPDFDWAAILNCLIGEQRYDPDCYNPPNFLLLVPPPADPPSPSTQPTITITQFLPPEPLPVLVEPLQAPQWTSVSRPPTPPIPWSQHTHQYSSMELYQEPQPEPTQELVDSDMSSPGPSPVISQLPSCLEPPLSSKYIVTEPFTPYTHTSSPGCCHNTHELQPLEIPSQPWREHLAYSPPTNHKCSQSPSEPVSASQHTHLSDGGYAISDVSPMIGHPYSSWSNSGSPPQPQALLMQSSTGSPEHPTPPPF